MLWIDYNILDFIRSKFPERWNSDSKYFHRKWEFNRFIQIATPLEDKKIHYEVRATGIELHFEGNNDDARAGSLIDFLMEHCDTSIECDWERLPNGWYTCVYKGDVTYDNIKETIATFVATFDRLITAYKQDTHKLAPRSIKRSAELHLDGKITLAQEAIGSLLALPLSIPDYQRAYCWEKENIDLLLEDIAQHIDTAPKTPYHLGSVILHAHDGFFDIIDGQQRLVTLALLCLELNIECPLQSAEFVDRESIEHIAYAKHLISRFCRRLTGKTALFVDALLKGVELSILVLQDTSIDLAYTFFSNQNSRGVPLTDYDLLKAHHLRYISSPDEMQAKLVAETWNSMIAKGHKQKSENEPVDYEIVLDKYIYNLRKWLRYNPGGDNGTKYRIKNEYQAAPIIAGLPPFGEQFRYYEPIQGGSHFFTWVQKHIAEYADFERLKAIELLRRYLSYGSDNHYRQAVEALAFAYYLKFGEANIEEMTLVLLRLLAEHRYWNKRATLSSILNHVVGLGLVQIIEMATAPTFVLAECLNIAKTMCYPEYKDFSPIQQRMKKTAKEITKNLSGYITVESFKQLHQ